MRQHTTTKNLTENLDYISDLMRRNGPEEDEYGYHLEWYNRLNAEIQDGVWDKGEIDQMRDLFGDAYHSTQTLQGYVYCKPHGYAGDYEIIEKIYKKEVSDKQEFEKFDWFFQAQSAPNAVRNRKEYFKKLLEEKLRQGGRRLKVLSLASGPCRGLKEYLESGANSDIQVHCIDVDPKAIQYAKELLGKLNEDDKIRFERTNIFKFAPSEKYDLIWSAGLFDYLDDRTFPVILSRYQESINDGGEIVIGNFHPSNPTKHYMEAIGQWYLNYRDDETLMQLAQMAGFEARQIAVEEESEGVNLFMRIKKR